MTDINLQDIIAMESIIRLCNARGIFRIEEMEVVLPLYKKLQQNLIKHKNMQNNITSNIPNYSQNNNISNSVPSIPNYNQNLGLQNLQNNIQSALSPRNFANISEKNF